MLVDAPDWTTKANKRKLFYSLVATDERRDFFSFEVDSFSAYCTSVEQFANGEVI